jgi:tetratricopeptide (TPR) repeat protein
MSLYPTSVLETAPYAEIREILTRLRSDRPVRLLLYGENGLGKSTAAHHLLRTIPIRNLLVLEGFPGPLRTAFAPFAEAFRALGERESRSDRARQIAIETVAGWLKMYGPTAFLAERIPQMADLVLNPHSPLAAEFTDVGFKIQKRLASLARGKNVVLLLRNIESYDDSSAALIDVLLRNRATPVSFVFTYDPVSLSTRNPAERLAMEELRGTLRAKHGVAQVDFQPFTPEESRSFVESILRSHALRPTQLASIHELTGGNARFIQELLNHLLAEGDLLVENRAYILRAGCSLKDLPQQMTALIDARLERLQDELRAVIDVAAVIGTEFQAAPITHALNQEHLTTLRRLRALERTHRLIVEEAHTRRFTYEAIRTRVYQHLGPSFAREHHLLIAGFLTTNPLAFDNDYHIHVHYLAAGQPEAALPHLIRSAEQSRTQGSYLEASARYGAAAQLAETVTDNVAQAPELWFRAGLALEVAGEFSRAEEIFRALARTPVPNHIRARAQLHVGLCEYMSEDTWQCIASLNAVLASHSDRLSNEERVHARLVIATALYHVGEWDAARSAFRKCFRDGATRSDHVLRARVHKSINMFYLPELALPVLEESWRSLSEDHAGLLRWELQHNIGCNHLLMGELERAGELFRECRDALEGFGTYRAAYPTNNLALVEMLSGRYGEAETLFHAAREAPMSEFDRVSADCHLAVIEVLRGEVETGALALARLYNEALVESERILSEVVGHNLGWARLLEGRTAEAERLLRVSAPTRPHLWLDFKIASTERLLYRIQRTRDSTLPAEVETLVERSGRRDRWTFERFDFWISELWFWE